MSTLGATVGISYNILLHLQTYPVNGNVISAISICLYSL
jgi:hypothetical protein